MTGFEGKTVVVTGGARGQGAAEVTALARGGADVFSLDVLEAEGAQVVEKLGGEPGTVTFRRLDALVVFLLSDEAAYVNGAEISVDGGYAAHGGSKMIVDAL